MVKQGSYYFSLLSKASTQGVHCPGHVRYVALRHGRVVIPAQLSGPQPAEDAEGAGRENCRNRTRNQGSSSLKKFPFHITALWTSCNLFMVLSVHLSPDFPCSATSALPPQRAARITWKWDSNPNCFQKKKYRELKNMCREP